MKIKDDRGRAFNAPRVVSSFMHSPARINEARRLESQIAIKSMKRVLYAEMFGMMIIAMPFMSAGYALVIGLGRGQALGYIVFLYVITGLGVMLFTAAVIRPWTIRAEVRKLRAKRAVIAVSLRACLACGYDFLGLDPDADGCTVCPECGGAWQITPMDGTSGEG